MARVLEAAAHRLGDNYPYFHPLYAGQMLKPPHPVARAAYALAMAINPNNHARDGGRASSEMEIEAVAEIARDVRLDASILGHLTSSGTFANLEALWVAGQLAPGKRILGSEQAHYTHQRISAVLKLDFRPLPPTTAAAWASKRSKTSCAKAMWAQSWSRWARRRSAPSTRCDQILALRERYGFRVHVDAAYGGYFRLDSRRTG